MNHNGKFDSEWKQVGFASECIDCLKSVSICGLLVATLVFISWVAWLINS